MIELNRTLTAIPPSGIRKFFDIVAEMPDVISLSVGEPDFDTPWHIRDEAIAALAAGDTHYTGNRGRPALLAEIASYLARKWKVNYDPKTEIVVTNGGSEGFDLAVRALLNPGDEVLIPSPSYVMYSPLIQLAGGVPVALELQAENNWQITADELAKKISPRTRAIVLNYPSNPTGGTYSRRELAPLARLIAKHNLVAISDEIYAELTFDGQHVAFASLPGMRDRTITLSGFSKAWAMTGFRLGYLAGPAEIIAACVKIHQYAALCAPALSQTAAIEALRNGDAEVARMRAEYKLRRDFCAREFEKMRLPLAVPAGAFYLFPDVSSTSLTGEEFALALLKKEKVAVVPGTAFSPNCENFIRLSFANSLENLTEAMTRIGRFVSEIRDQTRPRRSAK